MKTDDNKTTYMPCNLLYDMCLMVGDAKSLHDVQSSEQEQMMRTIIAFLMQFIRGGWICCVLHQTDSRDTLARLIDP